MHERNKCISRETMNGITGLSMTIVIYVLGHAGVHGIGL